LLGAAAGRYDIGEMMWRGLLILGAFAAALAAPAQERKFELRGRIEPSPREFVPVMLHGSDFPYNATATSDKRGRFRFKKLDPGQYAVVITMEGQGTIRRTVEVGPSMADSKGRVKVVIPFEPSAESLEASGTVSVGQLTIPGKAWKEYSRAQKALNKRDVTGAIARLHKAVEIAPHFVGAWNNLGVIAYQTGRYVDAEKYFRQALEHEPGAYMPMVNLGGALLSQNRFKEALPYNKEALKMRPQEALPNSQLGLNYSFLGQDELGLKHLIIAREIDPNHFSHPQITLARIYTRRGENENAARELRDFLSRHPDSDDAESVRKWLSLVQKEETPQSP